MDDARDPHGPPDPAYPYAEEPAPTSPEGDPLTTADLGLGAPAEAHPLAEGQDPLRPATPPVGETHVAAGDHTVAEVEAASAVEAAFDATYGEAAATTRAPAEVTEAAASMEAVFEEARSQAASTVAEALSLSSEGSADASAALASAGAAASASATARVDQLPRAAEPPQPRPPAAAPPPPPPPARRERQGGGCLRDLGLLVLAALLGVGLTLGTLFALNGSLRWASPQETAALGNTVAALQGSLKVLDDRMAALQGDLLGAQRTLDGLSGDLQRMDVQIGTLQEATAPLPTLQERVAAALDQLAALEQSSAAFEEAMAETQQQLGTLADQVNQVSAAAQRADRFLIGMRDLLAQVFAPTTSAVVSPTAPITATATPTATLAPLSTTPVVTPTTPFTPTLQVTPTPTATVPLSPTLPLSPTVEATAAPETTPAPAATPTPTAVPSIRGVVFIDTNRNGRLDSGELGLAGVRIALRIPGQAELRVTETDLTGAYAFFDLPPGRYVVTETDPRGYGSTTPNALTVIVRAGETAVADFGDYPLGR